MPPADGKTVIEALSANILKTRFEDIDRDTVDNTKKRILDVIGDTIGGANAPGNDALVKMVADWGGKKEATILGYGIKAPALNVAMVNCIMCRSFDSEPLVVIVDGKRYTSHISGTTVPTAVTLGESRGVSGQELITALVAGDDFTARLRIAADYTRGRPGALGSLTTFGAAAIAGRLLGLNIPQMRNAFGIALEPSGGPGGLWDGATTFKMSQGTTARNGIMAAELAKGGWTGVADPLFGEYGSFFGNAFDHPEVLTRYLGKQYYVESVFKPYPGCRLTHAGIDAALTLASKYDIRAEDIAAVTLLLSPPIKAGHCWKPFEIRDYPTGDALFSYKYSTASALLRKSAIVNYYTEEFIRDPELQVLIGKIALGDSAKPEGVELELKMNDGRTFSEYVPVARGDVTTALSRDEMIAKFMTQVEFSQTVSRKDAEKLVKLLDRLEEVTNVNQIVELAVKR